MTSVLLASFDVVPSAKGASQHILRNAEILGSAKYDVSLVTLGNTPLEGLRHRPIPLSEPNWLRRGLAFRQAVARVLDHYHFDVHHVRSPWEGLAVPAGERLIYEVNGFASIEMAEHPPKLLLQPNLLTKLRHLEDALLDRASLLITPSEITRDYLMDRGALPQRIHLVPNAPSFDPLPTLPRRFFDGPVRPCYIGTLASWQGLETFVLAMNRLRSPVVLTILTAASGSEQWALLRLAESAGVAEQITMLPALPHDELRDFLATQDIGLAPLLPGERNLVQGAMPIKILDYLAAGLCVLAPDLPVVANILGPSYPLYARHSTAEMIDLCNTLCASGKQRRALAAQGLARVKDVFSRDAQRDALISAYRAIAS